MKSKKPAYFCERCGIEIKGTSSLYYAVYRTAVRSKKGAILHYISLCKDCSLEDRSLEEESKSKKTIDDDFH